MTNHREIDCPVCPGPVCELDGNSDMVYILTYTHKHGGDVSAYRTREGAFNAAYGLACARVEEWDQEGACRLHFESLEDPEAQVDYFHEIEREMSYGEFLEITESQLGD